MLKRSRAFRECAAVMFAALLIVGIFATGILDRQKVWVEMTYNDVLTFTKAHPAMFVGEDMFARATYSLEDGDSYGIINEGPGFTLPKGQYRLKYRVDADGENAIRIESENGARIEPSEIVLNPDEWEAETWIDIQEDAINLQILFEFKSGTTMRVDDLRMYSPQYKDDAYTAALLIAAICLICLLRGRGKITNEGLGAMVVIGLAVFVCCAPALKDNLIICHDTTFHMARVMNLADGLAHGHFPVRLGGFTHNGYGALTSVFYPDLLLYPFALLIIGGASITYVMNLMYVVVNIVSAMTMYACAKRIFSSGKTGICASVLYVLSTYRVANLYSRCAVGEMWAMAVLPLFILGMWEVVFGDQENWPVLAAGAALVYLSHLLTAVLCAIGAAVVCVLCVRRVFKEGRFLCLIKAVVGALLVSLYSLVPFFMYSMQGIGGGAIIGANTLHMLSLAQLLLWSEGDMPGDPMDPQIYGQAYEIGIPMLLGAAMLLYLRAVRPRKDREENNALFFAIFGLVCAVISTSIFPWAHLEKLTMGYSNYLQFPARMLMVMSPMVSLGCAYAYMRMAEGKQELMNFGVLALSIVMVLPTLTAEARKDAYLEFGQGASPFIRYTEYMIPGSSIFGTFDRDVHTEGSVTVTQYEKESTAVTAHVQAQTDGKISVPLFGYDGYRATVDGKDMQCSLGADQRLVVHIPAGTSGELRVWFAGKTVWRVAEAVSVATALGLALLGWKRRRKVQ